MKRILLLPLAMISLCVFSQTPRIILKEDRLTEIKEAIKIKDSHHEQLFKQIKDRVDKNSLADYSGRDSYARSYLVIEASLMYRLTGEQKYASQVFLQLQNYYTAGEETPEIPDLGKWPDNIGFGIPGSKALTYVFPGLAFALSYDWVRQAWNDSQAKWVNEKITASLNDWEKLFRWELYNMPNSNWVSVCRGTEMTMIYAAGQEVERAERLKTISNELLTNYDLSYGSSGYSNEGIGYLNYGVPFGLNAYFAAISVGDPLLDTMLNRPKFNELLMYSYANTKDRETIMTSVDGDYFRSEGIFGQVFGLLSDEDKAYFKYFYDRNCGVKSKVLFPDRFDKHRLGAVWSMIFYPEKIQEKDPREKYNRMLTDNKKGFYVMRNHFDEKSIAFNIQGKYDELPKGHQTAETFNISMLAFGQRYFANANQTDHADKFSSLLVNGKARADIKDYGKFNYAESNESADGAGYVIVEGGQKYSNLGVNKAYRHAAGRFFTDGTGIISTLDDLEGNSNAYTWQVNVGNSETNGGITVTTGTESGKGYFLMKGANNGYVKGWILSHSGSFSGTDPIRFEVSKTSKTKIWVVMYAGTGTPPIASISGSGTSASLSLPLKKVSFDESANRIEIVDQTLAISDKVFAESGFITIAPNPSTDGTVQLKAKENSDLQILTINGQLVSEIHLVSGVEKSIFLPKGMYLVKSKNHGAIQKLVIE